MVKPKGRPWRAVVARADHQPAGRIELQAPHPALVHLALRARLGAPGAFGARGWEGEVCTTWVARLF